MIKFDSVTKIYKNGATPALENVTFNIERGEFVFLVGSSGSGKSTLLSLILRSERLNDGQIYVAGRDLKTLTNWRVPEFRQQIGVVFQNFRLLANKTVFENVAFALQVIGKRKKEINQLVPEALELVGLQDKADRFPDQLSGGERQRVAIARAFVNKPLIIMADEPTGNLDPATSMEIMKVFEMINSMGTTILMATHSEEIVNSFQKRVLELKQGHLVRDEINARYISQVDSDAPVPTKNRRTASSAGRKPSAQSAKAAPVAQEDVENMTVRIPKRPRVIPDNISTSQMKTVNNVLDNEFALADGLTTEEQMAYDSYYEQTGESDFFNTSSFDANIVRGKIDEETP
ncbi:MAG: cell division ATP-binding protein FtsE [Candidatus Ancillula sp.]|jgi:cell division transport system ATP-binding protein|nr:cell division ATP-binding protein FtsE [Candidatus Ancillula sp.]